MALKIAQVAKIAHQMNLAYDDGVGGEMDQKPWDECGDAVKQTAIDGVQFHLANPDASPEDSHGNWVEEMKAQGYSYGEEKSAEAKTHPCLAPWAELQPKWRVKDVLFKAVVDNSREFMDEEEVQKAIEAEKAAPAPSSAPAPAADGSETGAPAPAPSSEGEAPTPAPTPAPAAE